MSQIGFGFFHAMRDDDCKNLFWSANNIRMVLCEFSKDTEKKVIGKKWIVSKCAINLKWIALKWFFKFRFSVATSIEKIYYKLKWVK